MPTTDTRHTRSRAQPLRRLRALIAGGCLLAATCGVGAAARPLPILETLSWMCPTATLPLHVGAVQRPGQGPEDIRQSLAAAGWASTQAALSLEDLDPDLHVVVLAYLAGDPVDVEVVLTPHGSEVATWRGLIAPEIPSSARGSMNLWPYYLVLELPRSHWHTAFPISGPYLLEARPERDPGGPFVDGFCAAESASWLFVIRP